MHRFPLFVQSGRRQALTGTRYGLDEKLAIRELGLHGKVGNLNIKRLVAVQRVYGALRYVVGDVAFIYV